MTIDIFVQHLRRVCLFQALNALQITEIARHAQRVIYQPGQTIIEENKPSHAAILIVSGNATRINGPNTNSRNELLSPGFLIAEMGMLVETHHTSTIVAVSEVRALHICREDLINQMEQDPRLADHFMKILTTRLSTIANELRTIEYGLSQKSDATAAGFTAPAH